MYDQGGGRTGKSKTMCDCALFDAIPSLPSDASVTMLYVPFQNDTTVYEEMKALEVGTLFPVLNKPFTASGWCR